ncbi:LON peptidase substrate-binding domain-containing protein [Gordonia liuliyuniae]|uniref:LON peptidase substrate-binding domain-containing protein n=1 Tax=Gordonia liuliyuniae TaxID=2911517 RepID=A0ABS9IQC0_9ACTN|nr:LON peptidase substrate-binding domain-containing protein [Gordonia liuliyuniae]MCF8587760.1 LON peptidase substrate-binding domain-containing protein [Gordonia liuliyuniae]
MTAMFPLGSVLLPGEQLPLRVFEPRYATMFDEVLAGDSTFGVVLIERGSEVGGGDTRSAVGTLARVDDWTPTGPRRHSLLCVGVHRIVVDEWLPDKPYPNARTRRLPDTPGEDPDWTALMERRAQLQLLCGQGGRRDRDLRRTASWLAEPVDYSGLDSTEASFRATSDLPLGAADRQRALTAPDAASRVDDLVSAVDDLIAALRFRLQA